MSRQQSQPIVNTLLDPIPPATTLFVIEADLGHVRSTT